MNEYLPATVRAKCPCGCDDREFDLPPLGMRYSDPAYQHYLRTGEYPPAPLTFRWSSVRELLIVAVCGVAAGVLASL
jgi:hypothetical protein